MKVYPTVAEHKVELKYVVAKLSIWIGTLVHFLVLFW